MQRTPPKKVPLDPSPNTNKIVPLKPQPGWSSSLSQSSLDSSNSMNRKMISLGEDENDFLKVLSRSSKKWKKDLPNQKYFPSSCPNFFSKPRNLPKNFF
jgi:hypothetical protein